MLKKLEKNYVSDIDKLLQSFDEQHAEKTASQQAEITKHERIAKLRDGSSSQQELGKTAKSVGAASDKSIWDKF